MKNMKKMIMNIMIMAKKFVVQIIMKLPMLEIVIMTNFQIKV